MTGNKFLSVCVVAIAVIFAGATAALPQGAQPQKDSASANNLEPQWLWGEVVSVNTQSKTIQVKYLDYDTDIEKELVLTVDGQTKYENASGLDEIKPQDTISVDYIVSPDGVNLAAAISVEKLEDMDAAMEDAGLPDRPRVGTNPQEKAPAAAETETPAATQSTGTQ